MKTVGWLLLVVAAIVTLGALAMDTTVATGVGGRVHNIGLMRDQQSALMLGGLGLVLAVVLIVAGRRKAQAQAAGPMGADRDCPYCAERIKAAARLCRFCGKDLEPVAEQAHGLTQAESQARALGIYKDGNRYVRGSSTHESLEDALASAKKQLGA